VMNIMGVCSNKRRISTASEYKSGLYIHIPFCLSKCAYCSFYSIKSVNLIADYLTALQKEIEYYRDYFKSFDTIYFGGGTPSLLTAGQIDSIFALINKTFKIDSNAEITMETNAGDISLSYLKSIRDMGINRLNIGIQSFDDQILKFLGRRHSSQDAITALEIAKQAGFDNLGIDLIYGVYGQNIRLWKNNLGQAVSFIPEHISCYQLTLEEKTPLYKKYLSHDLKLPDEKTELKFFLTTADFLEDAGYVHYEVSNFARAENLQSHHNMKYWRHIPYLGVGASAHSFLGNNRWWNMSSVKKYIQEIAAGRMPVESSEELTLQQLQLEALFLGLRTKRGINLKLYETEYCLDLLKNKKAMIDAMLKDKLVELRNGFLQPTRKGLALADSLALI
jgi:oxygen-independent coproporphyrinogen III oxidase